MPIEQRIMITVVEKTRYSKEYSLAELEEVAGATLEDFDGDLALFIQEVQDNVNDVDGFQEGLERHGDVIGQVWEGEWVDPTPEQVGYYAHDGVAAVVYKEEGDRD